MFFLFFAATILFSICAYFLAGSANGWILLAGILCAFIAFAFFILFMLGATFFLWERSWARRKR